MKIRQKQAVKLDADILKNSPITVDELFAVRNGIFETGAGFFEILKDIGRFTEAVRQFDEITEARSQRAKMQAITGPLKTEALTFLGLLEGWEAVSKAVKDLESGMVSAGVTLNKTLESLIAQAAKPSKLQ